MRAFWAALAAACVAVLAASGCNDYGNTFQQNTGAVLTFLSPSSIPAGSPGFTLTVTANSFGGGFVFVSSTSQTTIYWNGQALPTTFVSQTTVTASITAEMIAKPGTVYVNTINPHSGSQNNGLSNSLAFFILPPGNPTPSISSLSPSSAPGNSATLSLTINGSNFLPKSDPSGGSVVHWNAGASQFTLPTTNMTATAIMATVDASLLVNNGTTPLTATVSVSNPPGPPPPNCQFNCQGSGGGPSNGLPFTINPPGAAHAVSAQSAVEETPAVGMDGRYVAYAALDNGHSQIFVRDTCQGAASGCQPQTTLVSVNAQGEAGNGDSHAPSMSADARYIAFSSGAANLGANIPAGRQIYVRDTCIDAPQGCVPFTQWVSTDASGALSGLESILPSISSSGRYVAFLAVTLPASAAPAKAAASNAAPQSSSPDSGLRQVFIRDTCIGAPNCTPRTTRISMAPGSGGLALGTKPGGPALSSQGAAVAFPGTQNATLFTRGIAVDDRVYLSLTAAQTAQPLN
jgi:hypothetical protein